VLRRSIGLGKKKPGGGFFYAKGQLQELEAHNGVQFSRSNLIKERAPDTEVMQYIVYKRKLLKSLMEVGLSCIQLMEQ
jgi:hypothetical protein